MTNEELDRIIAAQRSIKHPCWKYVIYDTYTGVVEYKFKPVTKWFNTKRIIHIKVRRKK